VPFTLSHPAAVLPLLRYRLPLSALVVGSMAPDCEYFLRLVQQDRSAHTFPGVLVFSLPAALVLLFVFQAVMKWPVIALMPRAWQVRLVGPAEQFWWWPVRRFFLILASLAVGIATHIAWDGFTHSDGWAVSQWASLRVPLFSMAGTRISTYKLVQHGSTLLGLFVLAVYLARWYRRAPREPERLLVQLSSAARFLLVFAVIAVAVTAGVGRGVALSHLSTGLPAFERLVGGFAVTSISVAGLELFGFSLVWRFFLENRARQRPATALNRQ
jgi:hypothetical protein